MPKRQKRARRPAGSRVDPLTLRTLIAGGDVQFPDLPSVPLQTESAALGIAEAYESWRKTSPDAVRLFEDRTGRIECAAAEYLRPLGYWEKQWEAQAAHVALEDYARIRALADPIYNWVPRTLRLAWVGRKHDNHVARLYYSLIGSTHDRHPAENARLVTGAALVNGLCRAVYAAIRRRLSRGRGVGFSLLRVVLDDDEKLCGVLRAAGLGSREAFAHELASDPLEVLNDSVSGYAAVNYRKTIPDVEDRRGESNLALAQTLKREVPGGPLDGDPSFLEEVIGGLTGRVVAGAGGRFSNAARTYLRAPQESAWPIEFAVPEEEQHHMIDFVADPAERVAQRELVAALSPEDIRLLRRLIADPPRDELAAELGISRAGLFRRIADLEKKLSEP